MTSSAAWGSKRPATWLSAGAGGGAGGGGNRASAGALGSAGVGLERVAVACCGADPVGDLLFVAAVALVSFRGSAARGPSSCAAGTVGNCSALGVPACVEAPSRSALAGGPCGIKILVGSLTAAGGPVVASAPSSPPPLEAAPPG